MQCATLRAKTQILSMQRPEQWAEEWNGSVPTYTKENRKEMTVLYSVQQGKGLKLKAGQFCSVK